MVAYKLLFPIFQQFYYKSHDQRVYPVDSYYYTTIPLFLAY
jgi:hypothetical protein